MRLIVEPYINIEKESPAEAGRSVAEALHQPLWLLLPFCITCAAASSMPSRRLPAESELPIIESSEAISQTHGGGPGQGQGHLRGGVPHQSSRISAIAAVELLITCSCCPLGSLLA